MTKDVGTYEVKIYIAGDVAEARKICRKYCYDVGLCVTLKEVDFIYTGGLEYGIEIGLLNYPRFPTHKDELLERAQILSGLLLEGLSQHSFLIVSPEKTTWFSRREQ